MRWAVSCLIAFLSVGGTIALAKSSGTPPPPGGPRPLWADAIFYAWCILFFAAVIDWRWEHALRERSRR